MTPTPDDKPFPTRRLVFRVAALVDLDGDIELTLVAVDDPYVCRDFRLTVTSAEPYPLGSTLTLEVPA